MELAEEKLSYKKDKSKVAEDDHANVFKLEKTGILFKEDESCLRETNSLRNRTIHGYDRTNDRMRENQFQISY